MARTSFASVCATVAPRSLIRELSDLCVVTVASEIRPEMETVSCVRASPGANVVDDGAFQVCEGTEDRQPVKWDLNEGPVPEWLLR